MMMTQGEGEAARSQRSEPSPEGKAVKILLVDDSCTIRNIQKCTLKTLGYEDVAEASDGIEALKVMSECKPDLLLVDWSMPNMDGITMAGKVRQSDKKTPIIMVTTEAEKTRIIDALKAGVNNYVIKPFTPDILVGKVRQTLEKCRAAA